MKIASGILVPISGIFATAFFHFNHDILGVICVSIAFLFATMFVWLSIKDRNLEKSKTSPHESGGIKSTGVAIDENTGLIIKVISDETNGFATLNDIARYTDLPVKRINKTLDWLFIHKFATEIKIRNGKAYVLTPEGKAIFSNLINQDSNKT